MTISMLGLAGIPATAGFIGKFYLIDAAVSGAYAWLGVVIVIGSMISLGYYLPVIATMWMGPAPAAATPPAPPAGSVPAIAGGSQDLEPIEPSPSRRQPELTFLAVLAGTATIVLGIVPQPLFNLVHGVGSALGLL